MSEIDLEALAASVKHLLSLSGPSHSPNLRKWLAKNCKQWRGAPSVFKDLDGVLWIGWIDDGAWFIGNRLWRCLTVGAKAEVGCWTFPISELTEDADFWQRYEVAGRCAIDERHVANFIDEGRWAGDDNHQTCTWCGKFERQKRRWQELVDREEWQPRLSPPPTEVKDNG